MRPCNARDARPPALLRVRPEVSRESGAFNGDREGSADAWALLLLLQETDSVPYAELPPAYRMSVASDERNTGSLTPTLAAFPNPAADRAMVTLPAGIADATLVLLDAQGRTMLRKAMPMGGAIAELDLRNVADGVYLLRLTARGLTVGEYKLTVAR